MWSRDRIWGASVVISDTDKMLEMEGPKVKGLYALVVGHTPSKKVIKIANVYHIDTCGWNKGFFTFYNVNNGALVR
jgi:hypothetical protein